MNIWHQLIHTRPIKVWRVSAIILAATGIGMLAAPMNAPAAESGKLVEKDGKYVFIESQDPALRLLLERALQKGIISKEEFEQALKESETYRYQTQLPFKVWYDRGFNFSMNDNAFFLKIRGRLQLRETTRWRNNAWGNPGDAKNFPELLGVFGDYRANRSVGESSQFNLRRARLLFLGHLINPDFKYFLQLGMETAENAQTPGSVNLLDYYFTSTHFPLFNVQAGQYKVYFNRTQINNTAAMQFAERSLVSDAFTANGVNRRDIGVTIMSDDEVYPVNYYFGIFNGGGPLFTDYGSFESKEPNQDCPGGQTSGNPFPSPAGCPGNQRNLNADFRGNWINQLMYTSRIQWNVTGRPGYGEGDLVYSETPQVAVAGNIAYNPGINTSTDNAFVGIDLANLNWRRQLATFGNARQLGWGIVDYTTWGLDSVLKYRGFSLQGEYYFKNINRHEKGLPPDERDRRPLHGFCWGPAWKRHRMVRPIRLLFHSPPPRSRGPLCLLGPGHQCFRRSHQGGRCLDQLVPVRNLRLSVHDHLLECGDGNRRLCDRPKQPVAKYGQWLAGWHELQQHGHVAFRLRAVGREGRHAD